MQRTGGSLLRATLAAEPDSAQAELNAVSYFAVPEPQPKVLQKHDLVTIIDERLAKRLWPEGAIGKRLAVYRTGWRHDLEVVGVAGAVRATRVRDDDVPHYMMPSVEMSLVIKTHETAERLTPGIPRRSPGASS